MVWRHVVMRVVVVWVRVRVVMMVMRRFCPVAQQREVVIICWVCWVEMGMVVANGPVSRSACEVRDASIRRRGTYA